MTVIAYIASDRENYHGLQSQAAIDRRRLAALIPFWEKMGHIVLPWEPGISCDVVYIVSLLHSQDFVGDLIRRKRNFSVVGGIIEDPLNAHFANTIPDDYHSLNVNVAYGSKVKKQLRKVRNHFAKLGLATDPKQKIIELIKECDGVITTSESQAVLIRQFNLHTIGIADCMPSSDFKNYYCQYKKKSTITIVWEGTAWGLQLLETIRPALEEVAKKCKDKVEFVFIGPRERPSPLLGYTDNNEILTNIYKLSTRQVDWKLSTIGKLLSEADIGIAPMPLRNPFYINKAYSKPLAYMACGLPVVVSPIPSYRELIRHGVDGYLAATHEEWVNALLELIDSAELRRKIGNAGYERLSKTHSEKIVASQFEAVFDTAIKKKVSK